SFRFATIASASACSRRERSVPGVLPHGPASAARAASTARSTSRTPAIAARARTSPVAGSTMSRNSPASGSTLSVLTHSGYSLIATATSGAYRGAAWRLDVELRAPGDGSDQAGRTGRAQDIAVPTFKPDPAEMRRV